MDFAATRSTLALPGAGLDIRAVRVVNILEVSSTCKRNTKWQTSMTSPQRPEQVPSSAGQSAALRVEPLQVPQSGE